MKNSILDINSNLTSYLKESSIKLLVFKIGKLTLALPVLQVQKIVKYNQVHGSGLSYVNLTHLDNQDIAIIDLHQKLFNVSLPKLSENKGYFIISKKVTEESIGILVSEPPALVDIATTQIRLIPDTYRRLDTLEIASHVTVITQENETSETVFILDLESLVADR